MPAIPTGCVSGGSANQGTEADRYTNNNGFLSGLFLVSRSIGLLDEPCEKAYLATRNGILNAWKRSR